MNAKSKEALSIAVFDGETFPVLSPAFQCTVHTSLEKASEFFRKMIVDVVFVGKTKQCPSIPSNIVALGKIVQSAQIIAIADSMHDAQTLFSNGAADCVLRSQLNAETIEQRALFVHARARYLKHGGDWQLYTHNDLAAIARVLSHDIRNTLSGIVLSLEPIRSACENNPEVKSYVDILERASGKLNQVVNRFSSATGNIALRSREENLIDVIRHAVATYPERNGLNVQIIEEYPDSDVLYSVDREKFSTAVINLLSNAIEAYEGKNGDVRLTAELGEREAILTIHDNGSGVDFTTMQNVFRPFFTTRPGKAGLGLPLAQSIIQAHGGTLRLESSNGIGTTVVCRFPLTR